MRGIDITAEDYLLASESPRFQVIEKGIIKIQFVFQPFRVLFAVWEIDIAEYKFRISGNNNSAFCI